MSDYRLDGEHFIIDNYDKKPAFSSFLPGLTGIKGIPMWVFYTNRGQGINSFGISHKGNAIMEFNPANTAYENTPVKGFRTFIKCNGSYFEPFCSYDNDSIRTMIIGKNTFEIEETNLKHNLKIKVSYMILPNENIGALVRRVRFINLKNQEMEIEAVDGMPKIIPYGIQNGQYKEMSNLLKSWTDISNIEENAPFYKIRASSDDTSEVKEISGGYFYCSIMDGQFQPVIYDNNVVFGYDLSLVNPVNFIEKQYDDFTKTKQYFANKIPCGFTPLQKVIKPYETVELVTYIGFSKTIDFLNVKKKDFCRRGYADEKFNEAKEIVDSLLKDVKTHTGNSIFDQYIEQCYLDNFLRGGYPYVFNKDGNKSVIHLFSRKHGDPERDYNFFSIAGEYYSQGNGNFRDVCQNRRNDVFFNKDIGDFNIVYFFSLIQMDGYNPLEIRPSTFILKETSQKEARQLIDRMVIDPEKRLSKIISSAFTPGMISNAISIWGLKLKGSEKDLIDGILNLSEQQMEAGYCEGYWSDHWDYLMDLIHNFLLIYPDRKEELLFGRNVYRYYDSIAFVQPRSKTYVISNGKVRRYGSVIKDDKKLEIDGFREDGTNWLKDKEGKTVTTTLFVKLIALSVNKFSLLDPCGMGIEMEGGKPGWNDAMNGLPGLFGSGMPETLELKHVIDFINQELNGDSAHKKSIFITAELADFMYGIAKILEEGNQLDDYTYWDRVSALREDFRQQVRYGVSGKVTEVPVKELQKIYRLFAKKVDQGICKAMKFGNGIMPTYFTYEAADYEPIMNEEGKPRVNQNGLPLVRVKSFKPSMLPLFLEGPARMLSIANKNDTEALSKMCARIKESDLYDKKLKMYKTSESLENISYENGRIKAFTPGWLERESIFLHMEYKYFLGMLKAGLYDEYYEAIKDALIPFLNPEVYGRSVLENSSFLASSVNPDPATHGRGYVARLSGSTTEVISMWINMFLGSKGFTVENGELTLHLEPKLAGWMFDEEGKASFRLCAQCDVNYHNKNRKNTYGMNRAEIREIILTLKDGGTLQISGSCIRGINARNIRDGRVQAIDVFME